MLQPHETIERIGRECYGKLLAILAAKSNDWPLQRMLLLSLFRSINALASRRHSPEPEAWLLTTARRKRVDWFRKSSNHQRAVEHVGKAISDAQRRQNMANRSDDSDSDTVISDQRLKLMFVCAHPAIDAAIRTPLMLQTLLGLDAARIASAMLIAPTTMGQRLSRAKRKIRDARIPFDIPDKEELVARLTSVLETIYAAFGLGWDDAHCTAEAAADLTTEAIWLARIPTNYCLIKQRSWGYSR